MGKGTDRPCGLQESMEESGTEAEFRMPTMSEGTSIVISELWTCSRTELQVSYDQDILRENPYITNQEKRERE